MSVNIFSVQAGNETNTSELDSHADTCCAGPNIQVVSLEDYTVCVKTFSDEYEAMPDIKVGTAETVYTHPSTGEAYILVINQALIFGSKLQNSLLTPNQMRANGVTVCDVPK